MVLEGFLTCREIYCHILFVRHNTPIVNIIILVNELVTRQIMTSTDILWSCSGVLRVIVNCICIKNKKDLNSSIIKFYVWSGLSCVFVNTTDTAVMDLMMMMMKVKAQQHGHYMCEPHTIVALHQMFIHIFLRQPSFSETAEFAVFCIRVGHLCFGWC